MAALAESGRSKLDVEVSYSSSNHPSALTTAEFANSKHEQQQQPKQQQKLQQPQQQPPKVHNCDDKSQPAWSTKLRSVPLTINFDVSVFATHDRHGRLTLHPVLGATEVADTAATAQPPTSRTIAQSLALRDCGSAQGDAEGGLGRNNCAKASIMVHCPQFGGRHCNQRLTELAETDLSTNSRASCSGAAVGATFTAPAPPCQAEKAPDSIWPELPRGNMCMHLHDGNRVGVIGSRNDNGSISSLSAASLDRAEPSSLPGRRRTPLSVGCERATLAGVGYAMAERNRPEGRHRRHHRPQRQQRAWQCKDCQSALPRFTAVSNQSDAAAESDPCPSMRRHRHQRCGLSAASLSRVVRKLEALLDAVDPQAAGAATTPNSSGPRPRAPPRNDLDVAGLRLEYAMHFCD